MTPAARLQAAIEILDSVAGAARDAGAAADTLIARYFKERRYAGSKDRRAVRELVYDAIRALGERPKSGRAAMIGYARAHAPQLLELFGTDGHAPAELVEGDLATQPGLAPQWLMKRLKQQFGSTSEAEARALLGRAPLDLRINSLKGDEALIEGAAPTPFAPRGLRIAENQNVESGAAYQSGLVEIQDEGSQLVCLAAAPMAGQVVVDLCAGAGGKTLALAAAMANSGRLIACDTDRGRLSRLPARAERAGATNIEIRLLNPNREAEMLADLSQAADLVLIDAPCSGTGTWRRNPEARWRLTPDRVLALTALQSRLLDIGASLVKPGGRLVYVVCSLLPEEGHAQFDGFFARNPGFRPAPFQLPTMKTPAPATLLTPLQHGCDGFFIAASSFV